MSEFMDCETWLCNYLGSRKFHRVDVVRAAAKREGYTKGELKTARLNLRVRTHHYFSAGEDIKVWHWYLPEVEACLKKT